MIKKRILCRPPVEVEQYHYLNDFHLLHYLGYHKVHLVLALDFTVSNGPQPTINKKSYHYIGDKSKLNMYEVSMSAVARAIYQYNEQANAVRDKIFHHCDKFCRKFMVLEFNQISIITPHLYYTKEHQKAYSREERRKMIL